MNFQWNNCSIFNNFSVRGKNTIKPTKCTCTHKGFPMVPKMGQYTSRFARFQNNQNKQTSIIDK
jgi:hypothetical protein